MKTKIALGLLALVALFFLVKQFMGSLISIENADWIKGSVSIMVDNEKIFLIQKGKPFNGMTAGKYKVSCGAFGDTSIVSVTDGSKQVATLEIDFAAKTIS